MTCGKNAFCAGAGPTAECKCLPGYDGNPYGNPFTGDGCVSTAISVGSGLIIPGSGGGQRPLPTFTLMQNFMEQFLKLMPAYVPRSVVVSNIEYANSNNFVKNFY